MQWLDFDGRGIHGLRPFCHWSWYEHQIGSKRDPLRELRKYWAWGRKKFPNGGMIGYFSYDFARSLEPRAFGHDRLTAADDLGLPLAWWTFYEELTDERIDPIQAAAKRRAAMCYVEGTDAQYERRVRKILRLIAAGDIYQANLTRRFTSTSRALHHKIYARLQNTPMPMSAFLDCGNYSIISHSPERFWSLQDGHVSAHPIKGTRPRGATPEADEAQRLALVTSAKDRAENVMIVDLVRNDLGRVCEYGSIEVPQLFEACPYPTVWHGVSTVTGTLQKGCDVFDLIRATFPCGSITGAPKIRAMQIIDSLEEVRRGVAMGAIGYINFAGNADFNVAIRTATCVRDKIYFHAGSGIVADSDPAEERDEIYVKSSAIRSAI